jgi:quercetin dioxygenase-like cupin family protein
MVEKIKLLASGVNVQPLHWALMKNPQLWNQNRGRTESPESPHHGLDDIWVRYGKCEGAMDGQPHESHWYECADVLGVKPYLRDLLRTVDGDVLGGVLITRIPPGATCKPHVDLGWHALEYQKYAVQIASAPGQKFCFEGQELETAPGDLFWFNNQHTHWVENPTNYERITMIACIK